MVDDKIFVAYELAGSVLKTEMVDEPRFKIRGFSQRDNHQMIDCQRQSLVVDWISASPL